MHEQFGFSPNHSTTYQLLCVVERAREKFNMKIPGTDIFLDIAMAFDKVCHEGLIFKLIKLKFSA